MAKGQTVLETSTYHFLCEVSFDFFVVSSLKLFEVVNDHSHKEVDKDECFQNNENNEKVNHVIPLTLNVIVEHEPIVKGDKLEQGKRSKPDVSESLRVDTTVEGYANNGEDV